MRRFMIGLCAGATAAYTVVRLGQSLCAARVPPPALPRNPAAYGAYRRRRMLGEVALGLARRHAFVFGGGAAALARLTGTGHPWAGAALSSALVLTGESLLDLPPAYAGGFVVERRYGLTAQRDAAWLLDRAKGLALGLVIAPPLATLFALARHKAPRAWPCLASAAILPLAVLGNVVGPLYLAPLFNRYEPLTGPLADRLSALARRAGVTRVSIMRVDMSRQTEKANAFVTGLFGAARIVVGDTLLRDFEDDEILWVVAHELGHYVRRDVWTSVTVAQAAGTVTVFAARALAQRALRRRGPRELGIGSLSDPAALPLLLHEMTLVSTLLEPAVAAVSRSLEWRADRFARGMLPGENDAGINALERLRERNLAEQQEPRWAELLFATHPSLRARIAALRER